MSNTLQEADSSDDEITMVDPSSSEDVSAANDILPFGKKGEKSRDEPENLVEATPSKSEEVILINPLKEQKEENEKESVEKGERIQVLSENEEEIEEITLVELENSPVRERYEGELFLAPRSKDNDQGVIRRKRQRAKKVIFFENGIFDGIFFSLLTCMSD